MKEYLPDSHGGLLPYWMLFVSSLAVFNSVQNMVTTKLTQRVYSRVPGAVTPLQARTFAIWTLTSAAIRLVAAYHLSEPAWYGLAFASYVFAGGHFLSEAFVFRSAGWGPGLLSPIIVASTSMIWMATQYGYYVN